MLPTDFLHSFDHRMMLLWTLQKCSEYYPDNTSLDRECEAANQRNKETILLFPYLAFSIYKLINDMPTENYILICHVMLILVWVQPWMLMWIWHVSRVTKDSRSPGPLLRHAGLSCTSLRSLRWPGLGFPSLPWEAMEGTSVLSFQPPKLSSWGQTA